jgi:hypothetical protein
MEHQEPPSGAAWGQDIQQSHKTPVSTLPGKGTPDHVLSSLKFVID